MVNQSATTPAPPARLSSSPGSGLRSASTAAASRTSRPQTSRRSDPRGSHQVRRRRERRRHVVFGHVIHTEQRDMYLARAAAINAGLPVETPLSR